MLFHNFLYLTECMVSTLPGQPFRALGRRGLKSKKRSSEGKGSMYPFIALKATMQFPESF
jgi:hypothetical protein